MDNNPNDNNKIECYIKNTDWIQTPSVFFYKLNKSDKWSLRELYNTKEFQIYETEHYYERWNRDDLKESSDLEDLKLIDSQFFLKVLLDGETPLYAHKNKELFIFYKINGKVKFLSNIKSSKRKKMIIERKNEFDICFKT